MKREGGVPWTLERADTCASGALICQIHSGDGGWLDYHSNHPRICEQQSVRARRGYGLYRDILRDLVLVEEPVPLFMLSRGLCTTTLGALLLSASNLLHDMTDH